MARRVTFTDDGARRIVNVVRAVERGSRDQPPIRFRGVGDDGEGVRLGTISGTWTKGQEAEVTMLDASTGAPLSPTITFMATNWFADISVDCGERKVACALVGGTWILVAAEC